MTLAHLSPRTVLAVAGTTALLGATAVTSGHAAPPDDRPCTRGQAESVLQAGIHGWVHQTLGRGHTGIAGAYAECSYFLFGDFEGSGDHYTFADADVFAGQVTWFYPYEAAGVSRQEAAADLMLSDDRVSLAELLPDGSTGPEHELEVSSTPVKTAVLPEFGLTAYRTFGVVLDLDPGEYVSTWTQVYDGQDDASAEVRLTITP